MADFIEDNVDLKINHAEELLNFLQKHGYELTNEAISIYKANLQQKALEQLEIKIRNARYELIGMCMKNIRAGITEISPEIENKEKEMEEYVKLLHSLGSPILEQLEDKIIKLEDKIHYAYYELLQLDMKNKYVDIKKVSQEIYNKEKEIKKNENLIDFLKIKLDCINKFVSNAN